MQPSELPASLNVILSLGTLGYPRAEVHLLYRGGHQTWRVNSPGSPLLGRGRAYPGSSRARDIQTVSSEWKKKLVTFDMSIDIKNP
jgi:hypothetical protein